METNKEIIRIYNTRIHEMANMSANVFLEKVKNVQGIRTGDDISFTVYPGGQNEIEAIYSLWEFVNGNLNSLNDENRKYFIVELPQWLYLFLRYTPKKDIMKPIILGLTGLYILEDTEHKEIMKIQIHPPVMQEIHRNIEEYFPTYRVIPSITTEDPLLFDEFNEDHFRSINEFESKFDYVFRDTCGDSGILPYIYPMTSSRFKSKSLFTRGGFDLKINASYLKGDDWERIVIEEHQDTLVRVESDADAWRRWKNHFNGANN